MDRLHQLSRFGHRQGTPRQRYRPLGRGLV
jgi:hypothetical protein